MTGGATYNHVYPADIHQGLKIPLVPRPHQVQNDEDHTFSEQPRPRGRVKFINSW